MISARVCGIPCQIKVTYQSYCAPRGKWADSRDECYGWDEIDFELYDRRGRRAEWLERKMTDEDFANAVKQIKEAQEPDYD